MSDLITLTSTTDTEADVRSALGLATATVEKTPEAAVAAPATEVAEETAAEADAVAEEAAAEQKDQLAQARRKKGRLQSRIDELTAERNRESARAAAMQTEVEAYRARVQELAGKPVTEKTADTPAKPIAAVNVPAEPKVEDFATYEDYTKSVAKWTLAVDKAERAQEIDAAVEKRLATARAEQAKQQDDLSQAQIRDRYLASEAVVREKYDDYDTLITSQALQATPLMMTEIVRSELGAEVTYYLATHPEECAKLAAMGNTPQALKEFGKVEMRAEAALKSAATPPAASSKAASPSAGVASSAESKSTGKPVATKAPDPITPVGNGQPAADSMTDPSQMPYQQFREWRAAQERKRSGLK